MESELLHVVIAIIGTGIALAVLNLGLFAWLRADIGSLRTEVDRQREELGLQRETHGRELADLRVEVSGQIAVLREEMREQMRTLELELRERMAKIEGLLEGLREAVTGQRAA